MLDSVQKMLKHEYPHLKTRLVENQPGSVFNAKLTVNGGKKPFNLVDFEGDILCHLKPEKVIGDRLANVIMNIREFI